MARNPAVRGSRPSRRLALVVEVNVAGFEMGIMIAIGACNRLHCIIRLVLRTERPLDPEAEAADAAEELEHAETSASASPVITAIAIFLRHVWFVFNTSNISDVPSAKNGTECPILELVPKMEFCAVAAELIV